MKTMFLILAFSYPLFCHAAFPDEMLIGGTPADPKDWPASVYAAMGNSRCSATVIGEKVLLIASHCVSNGGTASFSVGPNRYSSKCTRSQWYPSNSTADWALCVVNQKVTGIVYENVNQNENLFSVGSDLMLTGYGCVQSGGGGGNDGVYRIGKAKVSAMPSGTNNDIVTSSGAAICFGDSGGPAFFVDGNKRWVVSVNSRGDISTTSYIVATHTSQFKTFSKGWLASNVGMEICGISPLAKDCRPLGPITPPDPTGKDFDIDNVVAKVHGTVKAKYVSWYKNIVDAISQFLESFKE